MDYKINLDISDSTCEAQVVDPHGNTELVVGDDLAHLFAQLGEVVATSYEACVEAEEENGAVFRVTACGFCEKGVYRGQPCPYCEGTGVAPQDTQPQP